MTVPTVERILYAIRDGLRDRAADWKERASKTETADRLLRSRRHARANECAMLAYRLDMMIEKGLGEWPTDKEFNHWLDASLGDNDA
mgnify:CR=1 FL=1